MLPCLISLGEVVIGGVQYVTCSQAFFFEKVLQCRAGHLKEIKLTNGPHTMSAAALYPFPGAKRVPVGE